MALSALQRYVLRECYTSRKPLVDRQAFAKYYAKHVPPHSLADSITSSLERLIDRGLMVGFGRRTPKKWFIERVKLTPAGRRAARPLLGTQQRLPLT